MSLYCAFPDCDRHALAGEYCYSHDKELKRAKRDSEKVQKKKAIAKVSDKRKADMAEYKILREQFLEEYPLCQCSLNGPCNQKSETVHHTSLTAKNYLNTETWLAVSLEHHMIIENLSAEFRRNAGLLKD